MCVVVSVCALFVFSYTLNNQFKDLTRKLDALKGKLPINMVLYVAIHHLRQVFEINTLRTTGYMVVA